MRITFLGSSHGVPEPNRRCSCTLLEVGERKYLIDIGTNPIELLVSRGIHPNSINAVFITHMHGDHCNGLIPFVDLCSWYYKKANPHICTPLDKSTLMDGLCGWFGAIGRTVREFDISTIEDGFVWDDGTIRLTAIKTKHTKNSYAFLVEAEGRRVFFSGDLSHEGPADDFPMQIFDEPIDLAICEAAHFPATDYVPLFADKGDRLRMLCITHYTQGRISSVYEAAKTLAIPFVLATDGREIVL